MTIGNPVSIAVEGITDEAVARRLIAHVGGQAGAAYGKNGKPALRQRINGYAHAAQFSPWLILVDLDHDGCAPDLVAGWVTHPSRQLCFRVAVRTIETWLLADHISLAAFIGIAPSRIPVAPETLDNPKQSLVNLARGARKSAIRKDMVPHEGSGLSIGPAYASRVIEFASQHWCPGAAAQRSDSLRRAITCLCRLMKQP